MLLRNVFQRQVGILQIFPDICKDLPGHAADGFRSGASLHKLCKLLKDGFLQCVKITLPLGLHQPLREAGAGDIRVAERDFQEHTAGQLFEKTDIHDIGDQFHVVSLGSDGLELADIKRLPEAALNVVLIPELGHEIASYLEMELGQKYLLLTWPYGFNNTLQWLQHIGEAIDWPPQLEELKNEISLAEKDIFDECFLLKHNFLDYSLQRIIMTTPYSIADSLRQAIENSGYDIISAQEYYIKTDESEIIDEKRNYHIWNENISIDKLKADNYQLLLGTERERIGLGDLDRTIYLNFSMPSSKIKSKNIFFAGIRGWQNFMYMFKEQLNTLEYIKYQNQ